MSDYFVNAFIAVYLFVAWSWSFPVDSVFGRLVRLLQPIIVWSGLWHSWSMFAPNPIQVDRRFEVELTYSDGTVEVFPQYRIHEKSRLVAFANVRERKMLSELVQVNERIQRPALCRYVADRNPRSGASVVKSQLFVLRRRIKAIGQTESNSISRDLLWTLDL